MPGFARPEPSSNELVGNADVFNVNDVSAQTFYGFKYDALTGRLTVEKINDGSPVVLPTSNSVNPNDYKHWTWTKRKLSFSWNANNKTHLLTEVK